MLNCRGITSSPHSERIGSLRKTVNYSEMNNFAAEQCRTDANPPSEIIRFGVVFVVAQTPNILKIMIQILYFLHIYFFYLYHWFFDFFCKVFVIKD